MLCLPPAFCGKYSAARELAGVRPRSDYLGLTLRRRGAAARCAILAGMVLSDDIFLATFDGDIRGVEAALAAGDDVNDVHSTGATLLELSLIHI